MKLKMVFVIDEQGWPVRYGESNEMLMTPEQRLAYRSLRSRYKELQRVAIELQREDVARAAETVLQNEPKIRRMTRKVG